MAAAHNARTHDPYPRSKPFIHTLVWECSEYLSAIFSTVFGSGDVGGSGADGDGIGAAETFA